MRRQHTEGNARGRVPKRQSEDSAVESEGQRNALEVLEWLRNMFARDIRHAGDTDPLQPLSAERPRAPEVQWPPGEPPAGIRLVSNPPPSGSFRNTGTPHPFWLMGIMCSFLVWRAASRRDGVADTAKRDCGNVARFLHHPGEDLQVQGEDRGSRARR